MAIMRWAALPGQVLLLRDEVLPKLGASFVNCDSMPDDLSCRSGRIREFTTLQERRLDLRYALEC